MNAVFYCRFGQRLSRARKAAGLSQADLATSINLTRTSVSNIEKGRQRVLLHTFGQILDVLNLQPVELLPAGASATQPPPELNNLPRDERDFVERGLHLNKEEREHSLETDSDDSQGLDEEA